MKLFHLFLIVSLVSNIELFAQCDMCTFHEADPVDNTFNCDFPTMATDTCLVAVDTCFSGSLSDDFFNVPAISDPTDSQYFIIPPNMILSEVEWCITDQAAATSGNIQIGAYSSTFTAVGNGDMVCGTATLNPPLYPGVHAFSISGNLSGLSFVNWKITLGLASCDSMVTLSNQEGGTVDVESSDWIISSQILNAGAIVDYDAVDSIVLIQNFHSQLGSAFHAFLDGCGGAN